MFNTFTGTFIEVYIKYITEFVLYRSRYKTSRHQDTERGEQILRSLCYPYMVRYLSTPQSTSKFVYI